MAKKVKLLYGGTGIEVAVPEAAAVLAGQDVEPVADVEAAVGEALAGPIGSPPLAELVKAKRPKTVAITISDITRPVPNRDFLPPMLKVLNDNGVADEQVVVIIGTGMHRASTAQERRILLGEQLLERVEVIDHNAHDASTLVKVCDDPPVSVCRRFAQADFRIVTGYIDPHLSAGLSGGRKGVCPALVDLATIQRFHGYRTLAHPRADYGILEGNPCHEIALKIARVVGVDFLFNVAINRDRRLAGIYCGDLEAAHEVGCREVAEWTTARIDAPFDLVVTNGGGFPLDATFYQTVKGMCAAVPAAHERSTILIVAHCGEQLGSEAYTKLMVSYANDWRRFLADISARPNEPRLDEWEYQMQCRVLQRVGVDGLWFISDGLSPQLQQVAAVRPILGEGDAQTRAQRAIDDYLAANPSARVAVIPDGPYTMIQRR